MDAILKGISLRRRGFTLVELLVTIAIIGVLMSMLLPVYSKMKLHAKAAICRSNMKQIVYAFTMYAGDNRDRFPGPLSAGLWPAMRQDLNFRWNGKGEIEANWTDAWIEANRKGGVIPRSKWKAEWLYPKAQAYLHDYLGLPAPSTWPEKGHTEVKLFIDPGYIYFARLPHDLLPNHRHSSFYLNGHPHTVVPGRAKWHPFGKVKQLHKLVDKEFPFKRPWTLSEFPQPQKNFFLTQNTTNFVFVSPDMLQKSPDFYFHPKSRYNTAPTNGLYGGKVLWAMLDGSVRSVKVRGNYTPRLWRTFHAE